MSFGEGRKQRGREEHFAIETVRMSIAGEIAERNVTPRDTYASFTLDLEAGDADLETWLIGKDKNGVAYFVTVKFKP